MGVTLERVQNKFACIIGELCNEPVILSQFAIWVDLRIAEFKTKGAISLDCSGEEPEPEWMNGHRLPKRRGDNSGLMNRHSRHEQKFQPMGGGPTGDRDTGFLNEGRLSPELLLIKEEALSSHEHMHHGRKRSHSQTVSQADNSFYHQDPASSPSTAKMKRYSSSGDGTQPTSTETTSNQSLMSIISGGLDTQNQSSTDISASDIDVILDFENSSSSVPKSTDNQGSSSAMPEAGPSTSFDADNSFNRDNNMTVTDHQRETTLPESLQEAYKRTNSVVWALRNAKSAVVSKIRSDIKHRFDAEGLVTHTVRNLIAAATTLGVWLNVIKSETRQIEKIPVEELDTYLEEFFRDLKRRDGLNYDPDGFGNFRSSMDQYLARKGYGHSIRTSATFAKSQAAFKEKRKLLVEIANQKRRERRLREKTSDSYFQDSNIQQIYYDGNRAPHQVSMQINLEDLNTDS